MKTLLLTTLSITLLSMQASAQSRERHSFDLDWQFTLGDVEGAENPDFDDSPWRTLDVPHDWSIEGEFDQNAPVGGSGGYLPTGYGWYRKTFDVPRALLEKNVWIEFDGVYMKSDVWINGHHLGHRPFGYISFKYDISDYLQAGENVIAVRVDNFDQPNTRWYSGSGIYRHTWLTITESLHVAHRGVYATTPVVSADSAIVNVETTVSNLSGNSREGTLVQSLIDADGNEVARTESEFAIGAGDTGNVNRQRLEVEHPDLWGIDSPTLYRLHTVILQDGTEVDRVVTTIGIRDMKFDAWQGFLLNGERVKMHGVNLHHAGGPVGAAVPIDVWRRRFETLKEMGVNAIRTAHNPVAPEFLDLCDEMGFLVMNELFDDWRGTKRPYTYGLYFDEWALIDTRDFVLRDRNHPSVALWSAGNEIGEQRSPTGHGVLEMLQGVFHQYDPTRPVTTGNDLIGDLRAPTTEAFKNAVDIVGYNYADRWTTRRELYYSIDKYAHPDWKMIGTESGNIYGRRGAYSLGDDPERPDPNYVGSMIRAEQLWKFVAMNDYVAGDFMWTGIDYLGEARWPTKHASSGSLDLVGFPKDSFYFYRGQWTDEPVLHALPHWNWEGREGQFIPVIAYTNMDAVDLYINDRFVGQKRQEFPRTGTDCGWNCYSGNNVASTTADLHLTWDVPYEPGTLRLVGMKAGEVVMTTEIHTAGAPALISAASDRVQMAANGRDVAHIAVDVLDAGGNLVPGADNLITFEVEGPGKIIGVGNGNPLDHRNHKESMRNAFNGKVLAMVQSVRGERGDITVRVSSEGLETQVVQIHSVAEDDSDFVYYEGEF